MKHIDKYVEGFTAEDCYNEATSRRKADVRNSLTIINSTIEEAVYQGGLALLSLLFARGEE